MEMSWLWHRMGTFTNAIVRLLRIYQCSFLRSCGFMWRSSLPISTHIWVDMIATLMTTMIGSMSLSGVNALKRRKGLRELFSKKKPIEEEPVEEEHVEDEEHVERA